MSTTTTAAPIAKNPLAPASAATLSLIARYGMPIDTDGLLQGDASIRIEAFFDSNPHAKAAYETEQAERRSAHFREKLGAAVQAATERHAGTEKAPATRDQLAGLLRRAYARPSGDRLRTEMFSALKKGASAAQANVLLRKADGTFVERS